VSLRAFLIALSSLAGSANAADTVTLGLASNFSDVSTSTSNPFGNFFRDGVTLALEQSAAKLKSHGLVIVTKEFDYQTSTMKALRAAEAAATSDAVAVIGYNWSSQALVAAAAHQRLRLPMISPSASADRLGRMGRYIHVTCFDNSLMAEGLANVATRRLRAKTAGMVVASDCAYCRDLADSFKREFEREGGHVVADIPILDSDKNFTAAAQAMRAAGPDVIMLPNQELVSARIITEILQTGLRRPFLGGDGWGDAGEQFFQIIGSQPLEGYSVTHWHLGLTSSASKKFTSDYGRRFGKTPNDTAVLAYDATRIFIEALIQATTKNREGVEDALARLTTFEGVTGPFRFQKERAPRKKMVLLKNGPKKFEFIDQIFVE